ncbi:MAG: hypothetical protein ACYC0B_02135 [Gemmatimonadaceae bacterium]
MLGVLGAIVTLTAAAGDAPSYVIPVTAVATIFMFGVAYSDIRNKASAAHRRLDEKNAADTKRDERLDTTLGRMSEQITNLRLDLAKRGVVEDE